MSYVRFGFQGKRARVTRFAACLRRNIAASVAKIEVAKRPGGEALVNVRLANRTASNARKLDVALARAERKCKL